MPRGWPLESTSEREAMSTQEFEPLAGIVARPLFGRRALVTGGCRPIDAAIARRPAACGLDPGLARQLGPRDITINDIAPSPTATDIRPDDGIEFTHYMRSATVYVNSGYTS